MRNRIFWVSALCVTSLSARAQGPLAVTSMAYEQCIAEKQRLRDNAKQLGDRAWGLTRQLESLQFSSPQIKKIYAEADRVRDMADRLRCFQPREAPKNDKDLEELAKRVDQLKERGLKGTDPLVKQIIDTSLKAVNDHNQSLMAKMKEVQEAADNIEPDPRPPSQPTSPQPEQSFAIAGTYIGGLVASGGRTVAPNARSGLIITVYSGLTFSKRYNDGTVASGRIRPRGNNVYSFDQQEEECSISGIAELSADKRVLRTREI
jgi:hypothetical protein